MGLLQKAIETYDAMEKLAGIYEEGKEPLAPIGHIVTKAQIEITIDVDGNFIEAKAADKDLKIIIPVTEKSAGRTSTTIAPHPLCDKLQYFLKTNSKHIKAYIQQLQDWYDSPYSHPKLGAILKYVNSKSIQDDLINSLLIKKDETEEESFICWRVIGLSINEKSAVWEDTTLMNAYIHYRNSIIPDNPILCMLTGNYDFPCVNHSKKIHPKYFNAKIISTNDKKNFTYRGRFELPSEAVSVGLIASEKAHNALKWVIGNSAERNGGRIFCCWNPQGRTVPIPTLPLFAPQPESKHFMPFAEYKKQLHSLLNKTNIKWGMDASVILATLDATSSKSGRLSITYYNELSGSDFLKRLADWDEACCFCHIHHGVSSPSMYQIVTYAFGIQQKESGKIELDEKLVPQYMQTLLSCRIDRVAFPLDIMRAITIKASNLQIYKCKKKQETNYLRNELLYTACAVIQKYHIDHNKEAFELALEPERKDRSYQWGRLLALLDHIEEVAVWNKSQKKGAENNKNHLTHAIRLQAAFIQHPGTTAAQISERLHSAYYSELRSKQIYFFDSMFGKIMEQITLSAKKEKADLSTYGMPLTESYLPGYYLQKNAFRTKKENEETEEE